MPLITYIFTIFWEIVFESIYFIKVKLLRKHKNIIRKKIGNVIINNKMGANNFNACHVLSNICYLK